MVFILELKWVLELRLQFSISLKLSLYYQAPSRHGTHNEVEVFFSEHDLLKKLIFTDMWEKIVEDTVEIDMQVLVLSLLYQNDILVA